MAIVLDTETTGLLKPRLAANELQPQIIELYMAKFDEDSFEVEEELDTFVRPVKSWGEQILLEDPVNDLKHIVRITGITDSMLYDAPTFEEIAEDIAEFCWGEETIVGHNVMFDLEILKHNFIRVGMGKLFEDSLQDLQNRICTVEMSFPLMKKRLKLGQLYQLATGQVLEGAHRAKDDSLATLTGLKWLIEEGL